MRSVFFARRRESQAGQVGLVILLIMAGMLAVALSLAARTTQELVLSEQEKDSVRVFNAAEEGVERALSNDLSFAEESFDDEFSVTDIDESVFADVDYTITKKNELETIFFEGVSLAVDVTGAQTGDSLQIDWSREDNCSTENPASLMIAIFSSSGGSTSVRYEGIAACDNSDGFTLASTINENGYRRRYDLDLQTNDFLVRIRSVYADTYAKITGVGLTMPVQYYAIRSVATSTTGTETRAVEVNRTLNTAPSIFDYTIYSGTTLVK